MLQFAKALCDLGANINLMAHLIYKKLLLGEPEAKALILLMEDQSIKQLVGILYEIMVKNEQFISWLILSFSFVKQMLKFLLFLEDHSCQPGEHSWTLKVEN